jgi:hypothetical protein
MYDVSALTPKVEVKFLVLREVGNALYGMKGMTVTNWYAILSAPKVEV